jgi:hypothetical protein
MLNTNPISRRSNVVVQDLENEVLIYDSNLDRAFCLNRTAALVYQLCDGTRTIAEVSRRMSDRLRNPVSEDFVYLALDELRKNDLLENGTDYVSPFAGMARRQAVRRIGLASMIALPMISSLISPIAANAGSLAAAGQPCAPAGSQGNCASGTSCRTPPAGGQAICIPTTCGCFSPGDCISQTSCPSTVNCNGSRTCAP